MSHHNQPAATHGELRRLFSLALPLALYYITEVAMGITDMVIVGRLGSTELAAVGLTANIIVEFIIVCFGLLSMVGVLSSQALGRGDRRTIEETVGQGLWIALSLSVVVMIIGQWLPDLFTATGQDPEVVRLAGEYLVWMIWVVPFALVFVVLRGLVTVLSLARIVALITVPAVGLNLLLNYWFVFGIGFIPPMGVAGAGLASIVVNVCMVISLVVYITLQQECRQYRLFAALWCWRPKIWLDIFRLGVPAGMTALLEGGLFVVVGIMMGTLGADLLAANEILFHMIPVAFVVALAIGESAAVRIAFHVGAGNAGMPRWLAKRALLLGSIIMLMSAMVLWFVPEVIVALFIDIDDPANANVVEIVIALSSIAAIFQLFDGIQVVTAWCLRGLKDTLIPMWIASAGYWLCGLGSGYWFGFVQGYGAEGVWWGLATGLIMTGSLLLVRLALLLRRRDNFHSE